jgi:hypothetical protein
MPSNISLTFLKRCQEIKKATENFGFKIARFANRLRSATNWFENCSARATIKIDFQQSEAVRVHFGQLFYCI